MSETQHHWDEHYATKERIWSGRVNVRMSEIVADLTPGRALDLGCGEGGDAMWLAERGWQVVAVDVSPVALERAATDASTRNVLDRIDFQRHDLAETFPDGEYDLVSAQFLHSKIPLDRTRLLRRGAAAVVPGGVLLIVDHGDAPPFASKLDHHHDFPSAQEVVRALDLSPLEWEQARVEAVSRDAVGPDGEPFSWNDNVIVLRRLG